jgi:hypothetical protein
MPEPHCFCTTSFSKRNKMEKYILAAYEIYRQDTPSGYMPFEEFKAKLCKPCTPWWVYVAGGAAVGYALKK